MPIELDHLVYAGPDLQALIDEVHRLTGVEPVAGGRHEGRGTANALLGLGAGRYLELLGPDPDQPEPDRPRPLRVDEVDRPTLVGWAVRTSAIDDVVASAREAGYDPGDVQAMSRRTPSGDVLRWRLTPPEGGLGGAVPFLIDWQDSPHPSHGLPEVGLHGLTITCPEAAQVSTALGAVGAAELAAVSEGPVLRLSAELDTAGGIRTLG
ncbi:VOC family protein [Georgenia deserti]|uniref:VOC family protein n=1 Tax=Georgenia deserti TaxID=2093781 RepID=A0ABW4L7Z7_9MICO